MERVHVQNAGYFKALSDPNRLTIVEMLSGGELCACKILERLNISQPTLSHHMKILCESGLTDGRREGKWMYYTLNYEAAHHIKTYFSQLVQPQQNCHFSKEERFL